MESTEHDGDVEDYSEGESTEPEPRHDTVYFPDQSEDSVRWARRKTIVFSDLNGR